MENSPINKIYESRLKPTDLLARLNSMLLSIECELYIHTMEDFRDKWMKLCAYLLQENKNLDIVELIIEYSTQNWGMYGIDLNQDLWDWKTILSYVIKYGNYKLFKLINTLVFSLKGLHWNTILDLTIFNNWWDITERLFILDEIIKYWFQIRFLDIVNIIRFSDARFLRVIWESSCGQKVLNPKFIKLIFEHYNEVLKQKPDMIVELLTIFAKNSTNQILNWLSEQEIENIVLKEFWEIV